VSNNKYWTGFDKTGKATFKKPPIVCNDKCGNYNCTYTFYTEPDCKSGEAKPYRTATLYPEGCDGEKCQRDGEEACKANPAACRKSSDLIVRGMGTYFELDYTYKSVRFNGWGNCNFFLYEKEFFRGEKGLFKGYYAGYDPKKPWNSNTSDPGTLCRNFNMDYFNNETNSLETNDTCWQNQSRQAQNVLR